MTPHARTFHAVALAIAISTLGHGAHADSEDSPFSARADAHAPLGVMGDHVHAQGEWMLSYRYARMRMDGNRDGTKHRSASDVLADFPVTPTDMDMEMHTFGLMVAPTDWLTLTAMLPYKELSMDHVNRMGVKFTTRSEGAGDFVLSGLWKLFDREGQRIHLNTGVSFPTGRIRERDDVPTPMGVRAMRLPYPMQLGSGTFDLIPGLTYVGHRSWLSWGGQAMGTVRLDENKDDYRLGNKVDLTGWVAAPVTRWASVSGRIAWSRWWNINGSDPDLNPNTVPTADPNRRGGSRVELLGGVNLYLPLGPLGRHRFAVEGGFPIHQDLDGPQLESDWRIVAGWQKAF